MYKSTRGESPSVTFQQALLSGYAPDGGLYVPENLPHFTNDDFKSWSKLSYKDLIATLLPFFISAEEITPDEIKGRYL